MIVKVPSKGPYSYVDVLAESLEKKTKIRVRVFRVIHVKDRFINNQKNPKKPLYQGQYNSYRYRIAVGPLGQDLFSGEMTNHQAKMMLAFMCDFANLTDALARGMLAPVAPRATRLGPQIEPVLACCEAPFAAT